MDSAGEEPEDMMNAGEMDAEKYLPDMMLDEVFSCEINTTALMNAGVARRNSAPVSMAQLTGLPMNLVY